MDAAESDIDTAESDIDTVETELAGDIEGASIGIASRATWKVAEIDLGATQLGGTETATGWTFPASGAIFLDAWLNVTDAEAASTVDVGTQGTSNDPDGILDGVSVATAGYINGTGALRGKFITGSDPVSVTSSGDLNSCVAKLYISYLELPALS